MKLTELLDLLAASPDSRARARALSQHPGVSDRVQLVRSLGIALRLGSLDETVAQSLLDALIALRADEEEPEELRMLAREVEALEAERTRMAQAAGNQVLTAAVVRELTAERVRKIRELDESTARAEKLDRGLELLQPMIGPYLR